MLTITAVAALAAVGAWHVAWRRYIERAARERERAITDPQAPCAAPHDAHDPAADSRTAVLLLHGFGDGAGTLAPLAQALRARGFCVHAPLLPGHGRTLRAFAAAGADAWLAAAREALAELEARHERVALVGLSMGGALATLLAAERPQLSALVLLAPYLAPPRAVRLLARSAPVAGVLAPYLRAEDSRSIHDPIARERVRGYGIVTPRLVRELVRLADRACGALPHVRVPTLYIQSREDNRLTPAAAEHAFARLGAPEKRLVWLTGCGHVITVDYGWENVAEMVGEWVGREVKQDSGSRIQGSGERLDDRDLDPRGSA